MITNNAPVIENITTMYLLFDELTALFKQKEFPIYGINRLLSKQQQGYHISQFEKHQCHISHLHINNYIDDIKEIMKDPTKSLLMKEEDIKDLILPIMEIMIKSIREMVDLIVKDNNPVIMKELSKIDELVFKDTWKHKKLEEIINMFSLKLKEYNTFLKNNTFIIKP